MSTKRAFCFTKYEGDQVPVISDSTRKFIQAIPHRYIIYGEEVCPDTGRQHLQGFIYVSHNTTISALSKRMKCSVFIAGDKHPDFRNAIDYCKGPIPGHENKPVNAVVYEHGDPPTDMNDRAKSAKRNDLEEFKDAVKAGNTDPDSLMELHTAVYARYTKFCDRYVEGFQPPIPTPDIVLRPWQITLFQDLKGPADRRKIIFIVDLTGNGGKSTFTKYVGSLLTNVQIIEPGKVDNMAYLIKPSTRILFVDCPRASTEYLQFPFLEAVKNGRLTSYKYECKTKIFREPVHVVVMMNSFPDDSKLSKDRYDIREINMLY